MFVARTSLADHYVVPSGSMEPTVQVGDRIVVDKRAYGLRAPLMAGYVIPFADPAPGDVVVLASPEGEVTLLKRVVAGPGSIVAVADGRVVVNGVEARWEETPDGPREWLGPDPHPVDTRAGGGPDFGPVRVPEGHFLVLGDNRGNSHDGRAFGFVPRGAILGRATRVFVRDGKMTWRTL